MLQRSAFNEVGNDWAPDQNVRNVDVCANSNNLKLKIFRFSFSSK